MILYHGTSTKYLERILQKGILPRKTTRRKSYFEDELESKRDFVYLTSCYPVYFACIAAQSDNADIAVLKVDVPEEHLFPDEDYIGLAISRQLNMSWKKARAIADPKDYQQYWRESLKHNGILATPKVLASWVVDHRILSPQKDFNVAYLIGADAEPTPMNYQIKGRYYRKCMDLLFTLEVGSIEEAVRQTTDAAKRPA